MQGGQAAAKLSLALTTPVVVTALRFGFGALALSALRWPRLPRDPRTVWAVIGLGTSLAAVNVTFYQSVARIPMGVAVTVQFLGPLAISLVKARRFRHVVWGLLAASGVVLINYRPAEALPAAGLVFAFASAACWAAFILFTAQVGARTTDGSGLTLGAAWAALLTLPIAVVTHPGAFVDARVLAMGAVVALLTTVVANSLELRALRRIPSRSFGVLVSLEPVVAALIGLLVLDERLTPTQWLAVAAIVAASIGVTADHGRDRARPAAPSDAEDASLDVVAAA